MADNHPARIDRAALERIVQRAAELQTGEREIGDALTPDEVLALGKDVGIPARYLQQAMLEEQTRTPAAQARGLLDHAVGPAEIMAQRVVRGDSGPIEAALMQWMDDHELLAIQRQQPNRITWEPLRGFQAAMRRSAAALGGGKRPFMLSRASLVAATTTPLEPGYTHVSLSARLGAVRASMIGGALALETMGLAGAGIMALLSPYLWLAAIPLAIFSAVGLVTLRQYRSIAERVQLGLERALDHLERGEVKPTHALQPGVSGVLGLIAEEVRKALKPASNDPTRPK